MDRWLTLEVQDAEFMTAADWRRAHEERLIEAGVTNGAKDWNWVETRWGLVLEIEFGNSEARQGFKDLPAVTAALDAVPDPVNGLAVYPGRGGGSGARQPRKPRPAPAAGAVEADEPREQFIDLSG